MGLMDRLVGAAVSEKLATWTKEHAVPADYPAADLEKLREVATEAADELPALAKDLQAVLPKRLPAAADAPDELKTSAQRVTEHLLQLLPGDLAGQLEAAHADDVAWTDVQKQYGDLRKAIKAAPYWKDALPEALATFAANHDVSADELAAFSDSLEKVRALLPLVEMVGPDLKDRLAKLDEVLAGLGAAAARD